MDKLKASFADVADWCETNLEDKWGREIGMTFGAMLRAYGRSANLTSRLHAEEQAAKERQLIAKADKLLLNLSTRVVAAHKVKSSGVKPVEPSSMRANMIYDPGPRPPK